MIDVADFIRKKSEYYEVERKHKNEVIKSLQGKTIRKIQR